MSFTIAPAVRSSVKPLLGFYGKSGGGKTMSALLVARGLVGPSGRICLIDTENRRGSIFADVIPGGYSVLDLDAPFSPDRYIEAIETAEQAADCIVVDSMSHSHDGEGGILDWQEAELTRMAGEDWKRREACKMAAWIKPKMAAKRMVQRLLRSRCAIICCLRAQEKTHIVKDENGKTKVETDEFTTPIMDSRFIFELLINAEIFAKGRDGGYVHVTKVTHHDIANIMPKDGERIGLAHGEALAKWCAGDKTAQPTPTSKPKIAINGTVGVLKKKLWTLLQDKHQGDVKLLEQHLWDEGLIDTDESLAGLSADRLTQVLRKVEAK